MPFSSTVPEGPKSPAHDNPQHMHHSPGMARAPGPSSKGWTRSPLQRVGYPAERELVTARALPPGAALIREQSKRTAVVRGGLLTLRLQEVLKLHPRGPLESTAHLSRIESLRRRRGTAASPTPSSARRCWARRQKGLRGWCCPRRSVEPVQAHCSRVNRAAFPFPGPRYYRAQRTPLWGGKCLRQPGLGHCGRRKVQLALALPHFVPSPGNPGQGPGRWELCPASPQPFT